MRVVLLISANIFYFRNNEAQVKNYLNLEEIGHYFSFQLNNISRNYSVVMCFS
jgi:hypothetical protein